MSKSPLFALGPQGQSIWYDGELVGPHTVNTVPEAALLAFADHGEVRGNTAAARPIRRARAGWPAGTSPRCATRSSSTTPSRCSSPSPPSAASRPPRSRWPGSCAGRPSPRSSSARTDEQLADNLRAAELALSDEEMARLDAASQPPLLYPYWHQAKTARGRLSPADLTLLGPHLR